MVSVGFYVIRVIAEKAKLGTTVGSWVMYFILWNYLTTGG
jgi:hypothetical protein